MQTGTIEGYRSVQSRQGCDPHKSIMFQVRGDREDMTRAIEVSRSSRYCCCFFHTTKRASSRKVIKRLMPMRWTSHNARLIRIIRGFFMTRHALVGYFCNRLHSKMYITVVRTYFSYVIWLYCVYMQVTARASSLNSNNLFAVISQNDTFVWLGKVFDVTS